MLALAAARKKQAALEAAEKRKADGDKPKALKALDRALKLARSNSGRLSEMGASVSNSSGRASPVGSFKGLRPLLSTACARPSNCDNPCLAGLAWKEQ